MQYLTPDIIQKMSYTDFIALIEETNRCPGGKNTIRKIAQNTFINPNSNVLEIGANTGFTSLEIARLIKCKVTGIDISEACIQQAKNNLSKDTEEIRDLVTFLKGSAYEIPFKDAAFDLVIVGGATSFMDKKPRAIEEYLRVIKPWGFLSVTQLFYKTTPPESVVSAVSRAIGVNIETWYEKDWKNLFLNNPLAPELYYYKAKKVEVQTNETIDEYIAYFMAKPHLQNLDKDVIIAIRNKWKDYIDIFNENHKYLGYFIAIFRKRLIEEEPELFSRR